MHLQLDAKLRALESVLKCGVDASNLFKHEQRHQKESSVQTELNVEEIVKKEH